MLEGSIEGPSRGAQSGDSMRTKVLVTGADGLLGSACVALLLEEGAEVVALVRDRDPRSPFYRQGLVERCVEVRSELARAGRLLAEYQPQTVLHLAAQTQVPVASADPMSTWESNLRGTWMLLEACRTSAQPPRSIVVASSDKAYGSGPLPTTEDSPLAATTPYDVSKAATDMIARSYGTHFAMPVVVTRCGNLYGPGDLNEARLVPGVCMALARGESPQLRSTGEMTREWLHVEDAARATLLLAERAATHAGVAFNVGGGERASAREVARMLAEVSGNHSEVQASPQDPRGEIPHQALDSSRLQALGWEARISLAEGLAGSWAWYETLERSA